MDTITDAALGQAKAMLPDTEAFLASLRAAGASKIHSIRALASARGLDLGDAKWAVHSSQAWADRKASDEAFEAMAFQAIFGAEEPKD